MEILSVVKFNDGLTVIVEVTGTGRWRSSTTDYQWSRDGNGIADGTFWTLFHRCYVIILLLFAKQIPYVNPFLLSHVTTTTQAIYNFEINIYYKKYIYL